MVCLNLRPVAAVLLGLSASAGCGLISSDVTDFDLTLPDKKFTIDADSWAIDPSQASSLFDADGRVNALPCSSMPTSCGMLVTAACPMDCTGSCNAAVNSCELSLDISRAQTIDLVSEKPELKSINDQPVIKVTVDSVTYQVTANDLNVPTPEIRVYVAPTTVLKLKPDAAQATLIGTIPAVSAGETTGERALAFTATGKTALVDIMSQFKIPFNVLVGSSLKVTAGQALPTGKLEAVVRIRGHAGL